jgi:HSP20 family molecular chaperone IbpA
LKPIGPRPNLDIVGGGVWEQQLRTLFMAQAQLQLRVEFALLPSYVPPPPLCIPDPCPWVPPADAFIKDGILSLRYGIPGIDSVSQAKLVMDKGRLKISGSLKRPETDVWRKVMYNRFERTLPLPEGADASALRATFSAGILEVTMPMRW